MSAHIKPLQLCKECNLDVKRYECVDPLTGYSKQCYGYCRKCWPRILWKRKSKYLRKKKYLKEYFTRIMTRFIVLDYLGNKCVCCGEEKFEFLTIDHINNNGNIERKIFKDPMALYKKILNAYKPEKQYQILCWNCNSGKYYYSICPHVKEIV